MRVHDRVGIGVWRFAAAIVIVLVLACSAPSESPPSVAPGGATGAADSGGSGREVTAPVGPDTMAPNLAVVGDDLYLSWLERVAGGAGGSSHRLRVARLHEGSWSEPSVVAEGDRFFANWADIPAVAAAQGGILFAHWLAKTGDETYAYSVFVARSDDGGVSWASLGALNDDDTPTEHGFVSFVPEGSGVRAFWLDGREMLDDQPMALRTAWIGDRIEASEVLDPRVCECCATAAAPTDRGPVVVFRDRSPEEIRDIGIVRRVDGEWIDSQTVHADHWQISGCPVNGPEVAAHGSLVAVVWYSAGGSGPRVQAAFSSDSGATFAAPQVVDQGRPLGRVDVVIDGRDGALVSWMEAADGEAEVRLRRLSTRGAPGEPVGVVRTSPARASGFPRLARLDEVLYLAWVDTEGDRASRVRLHEIPVSAVQ